MSPKVSHIGIAVANLGEAIARYTTLLGHGPEGIETIADQKVKLAIFTTSDSRIELMEGTGDDSPITKFVARRGAGLHHICLEVADIQQELIRLRAAGVHLIDETPRPGAEGALIAFIHPESASGVLIELQQKPRSLEDS